MLSLLRSCDNGGEMLRKKGGDDAYFRVRSLSNGCEMLRGEKGSDSHSKPSSLFV